MQHTWTFEIKSKCCYVLVAAIKFLKNPQINQKVNKLQKDLLCGIFIEVYSAGKALLLNFLIKTNVLLFFIPK